MVGICTRKYKQLKQERTVMEKYKITKTIRFKLEAKEENILNIQQDIQIIKNGINDFDLVTFVSNLDNYIDDVNSYLFYQKENKEFAIKDKMTIKNEWLKQYVKQEFIEYKEKKLNSLENRHSEKITIGEINGLSSKIEKTVGEIDTIYAELASDAALELNERSRKAQTGLLMKRLSAKNALPLLMSLIENTLDKNETDDLSIRLKRQSKKINTQLLAGILVYLPDQSSGLPIAKASFNYYTINKKPIDFVQKIEEQTNKLKMELNDGIQNLNSYVDRKRNKQLSYVQNNTIEVIVSDIRNQLTDNKVLLLGDAPMLDIDNYMSLRQILKNIKANQKKSFSQFMQEKNFSLLDLKNHLDMYLFNDIQQNEFDNYKQKTEKIENKGKEINQHTNEEEKKKLRSELQSLKKQRGSLIDAADKNTQKIFNTYKSFANFYRVISQKHGKILAQLKGIEKEQIESQLLKYWALIVEENNQHRLILIPKEKAIECKKWLENTDFPQTTKSSKLIWFESFTLRSLRKLCFGYVENGTNEFYKEISKSIELNRYKDNGRFIQGEFAFKGDEQKIISFYKDVLQSKYAKKVLNIPIKQIEEEIINTDFDDLDDFQIALEKICYIRNVICSQEIESELKKYKAQIFGITSYDLKNNKKPNIKDHTKLWRQFWRLENEELNFDIRLNPEITITYRMPKQSRIEKYGVETTLYDSSRNNRYLYPQYTLISTVSEHSNAPTKILSFVTDNEYHNSIETFNSKLKREAIKFSFGIDNGVAELSTLGVFLPAFQKENNDAKIEELNKVSEYGFKVLSIINLSYSEKDTNGKERKIIQNPSYFLNKEIYMRTFGKTELEYDSMFQEQFTEKHLLTLDLTTSKVINGKIITNGDIPTHFNLCMRNAQRLVYNMNDHSQEVTAKKIILKTNETITESEKQKIVELLFGNVDHFQKLDTDEKKDYVLWTFDANYQFPNDNRNQKFKKLRKHQTIVGNFTSNTVFAVSYIGEKIQSINDIFNICVVFQSRRYFDLIKSESEILSEINNFNVRSISNEELELKINHLKQSIVANAVGIIDFLYKQYKQRFGGEGLIVKEGFDTNKVADDLEKFSGNIYRILERRLYQKFQNYGLVPPIKSLLSVRADGINDDNKTEIMRLGNIGFVSKAETSQNCPVCNKGRLNHTTTCSLNCGFDSDKIMHSNDGIAGYNIAKRGFENFK